MPQTGCVGLTCLGRVAVPRPTVVKRAPAREANAGVNQFHCGLCFCRIITSWEPAPCVLPGDFLPSTRKDDNASQLALYEAQDRQNTRRNINRGKHMQSLLKEKSQGQREGKRHRKSAFAYSSLLFSSQYILFLRSSICLQQLLPRVLEL
jgi:hypothetical protein